MDEPEIVQFDWLCQFEILPVRKAILLIPGKTYMESLRDECKLIMQGIFQRETGVEVHSSSNEQHCEAVTSITEQFPRLTDYL